MFSLKRPIEIRPDVPGMDFLVRLKDFVLDLGSFDVLTHEECNGFPEDFKLEFSPRNYQLHRNFSASLIATHGRPQIVELHLLADWWEPALDYSVYTATAREVMNPLLRAYNRRFKARVRLGIPGPRKPRRLPREAQARFNHYVGLANKGYAHPGDWYSFYQFIVYCHDHRVLLETEELEDLLTGAGFGKDTAKELASVYRHGVDILRLQNRIRSEFGWARAFEERDKRITLASTGRPASPSAR